MKTDKAIDRLNALLRGELAATETYQQALEKVHNEPERDRTSPPAHGPPRSR